MMIHNVSLLLLFAAIAGCAPRSEAGAMAAPGLAREPVEEAAVLTTASGTLHGTLLLPAGAGPVPVALIIAGSGPTDRNGNSALLPAPNNSLKLLAEGLAGRGIASLRYDKRGIAASAAAGPLESDLRFDTYVNDAAAWIASLRADPRFSSVSVIGHSEGSLIGMRAVQQSGVEAFASIAGPGRPAADVLREQLRPQLPPALWDQSERILTALTEGRTVDQVPAELMVLYRPSVQPYLISYLRLNPSDEIARVNAPVLIVQGTTDIQVNVSEAHALHGARPNAELAIVEGMNHVLKMVPADPAAQQASYYNPDLPVAPQLIDRLSTFIVAAPR